MNEEKVEQLNQVQKNPYQEEFNEDEESGGKYLINNNSSKSLSVMPENKLPSISMENIEKIIESISNKANKINSNITNILTIDVLKNPAQFPVQISLLRKLFSDLEKDISEFKKVLKYIFNVPDELSEEEDIFTDLLRLVLGDDEPDQKVKAKIKQNVKFDLAFIKDLLRGS
jgi:hypothetical protein